MAPRKGAKHGIRMCRECRVRKPIAEFAVKPKTWSGGRDSYCLECRAAINARAAAKDATPLVCRRCGRSEPEVRFRKGNGSTCEPCRNAQTVAARRRNRELDRERMANGGFGPLPAREPERSAEVARRCRIVLSERAQGPRGAAGATQHGTAEIKDGVRNDLIYHVFWGDSLAA